ncbi:MAG: hypothetical protein KAS67_00465 [Thermoplasmata archaeon]|nr:hypothetical protein [Thermoplasmata archaeon]
MAVRGDDLVDKLELKTDAKKNEMALLFIILGVAIRLVLADYPNIEPVLAIALLAGVVLGGIYALLVPLSIMALSDWAIYAIGNDNYFGLQFIIGLSFFTWSGMMLAGMVGIKMRPRFAYRMKTVAVFTGVGILMTLAFDAWTMLGWYLLYNAPIEVVLAGQVPFTIRHLFSTLIFVPLLTTMYIYIHEYDIPSLFSWWKRDDMPDDKQDDAART